MTGEIRTAIGRQGEAWFESILPRGWFLQPPRTDLGKDGLVVIRDESDLHNIEFSVQVKSTDKPRFSNNSIIVTGVSKSSIYYWFSSPQPTLIVTIDLNEKRAWYIWHLDLFDSPEELNNNKKTVTLHIPLSQCLNESAWNDIRLRLVQHYQSIQNALSSRESYVWLIAAVNILSTSIRNLVKLSENEVPSGSPSEDEGISLLIEQQQHNNILVAANKSLKGLNDSSPIKRQIAFWKESYSAMTVAAFPYINKDTVKASNRFSQELAFNPKLLKEYRSMMIFASFDLIAMLTRIYPPGNDDAS